MKAEYLLSTSLSVILHGAVAVGLYQSMLVAPSINFSAGGGGFSVSLVSLSEIEGQVGGVGQRVAAPATEPAPLTAHDSKPEVSLSKDRLAKTVEHKKVSAKSVSVAQADSSPNHQQATGAQPSASQSGEICDGSRCDSRAAFGGGSTASLRPAAVYAPKPPYPWAARRAGFEGALVAMVDIAKDGRVKAAQLIESSGREDCDRTALDTIREHWRFEPARFLGQPVEWRQRISIVYSLRQ